MCFEWLSKHRQTYCFSSTDTESLTIPAHGWLALTTISMSMPHWAMVSQSPLCLLSPCITHYVASYNCCSLTCLLQFLKDTGKGGPSKIWGCSYPLTSHAVMELQTTNRITNGPLATNLCTNACFYWCIPLSHKHPPEFLLLVLGQ